ncbi:MAG: DHHA1 domain-containing protein [Candidatus Njordarchaeia archaeon]|nr:hypothetical protein [Candidatus Korarchaeota archaeon]
MKAAVHKDDIDGICCAALILLKYPNAKIDFLSVLEAKESLDYYDIVADLPKGKNTKANIDHHESNYKRLVEQNLLTTRDLIDPNAPSATRLLANYLDLTNNKIAIELVEMADLADTGNLDDTLYKLDKIIKSNLKKPENLLKIAKILASRGRDFINDPWIQKEWSVVSDYISRSIDYIKKLVNKAISRDIRYMIFDLRKRFPYFIAKDVAHEFLSKGGLAVAVTYLDPDTQKSRISLRISNSCDIHAGKLAEKFGGGGHEKAAGSIPENFEKAIYIILNEFSKKGLVGFLQAE